MFVINGAYSQLLEWEEYGFRIQVPAGAFSGQCDIALKAIVSGQFELPKETELVSVLYAIAASRTLEKPVCVEIEHCVKLENEQDCKCLCFGVAMCNQEILPYTFEILKDGAFSPCQKFGNIYRKSFSILGIFKRLIPYTDTSSSQSEADTYEELQTDSEVDDDEQLQTDSEVDDDEQLQTDDLHSKTAASDPINDTEFEKEVQSSNQSQKDLELVSAAEPEVLGK